MSFNLILLIISIIIIATVLWLKSKESFVFGWMGENSINRKLRQLDPNYYRVLNNLLLSSDSKAGTTQIDHVIVSNFGIFCIETKAYSGWIFGDAYQKYWTQKIYGYKKRFYNPLWQNYAHTKAVEALIKPMYPNALILSFVAFPIADSVKISGTDVVGGKTEVIDKIAAFSKEIFSNEDKDKIFEILTSANIQDKEARKLHNRSVRDINQ